ncbi:hypothetical protein LIER_13018 [Lithospermum erythrorhizon]|uniref:FAD/NAD(P)-binding domain-containing protein n=1 Tax=Lithospermum erythrorhizon TaxID=34254 RepID=A0AAV3PU40_LITER
MLSSILSFKTEKWTSNAREEVNTQDDIAYLTWLVLALGAEAKLDVVPGASEYAIPFSTLEDAHKVDRKLRALERRSFVEDTSIRVTVVGCGYSGVELAATIAERLQDKGTVQAINVDKTILPDAPAGNREAALKMPHIHATRYLRLLGDNLPHLISICNQLWQVSGFFCLAVEKITQGPISRFPKTQTKFNGVALNLIFHVLASRKVELLLGYFVRSVKRESEANNEDASCVSETLQLELQPAERGGQGQTLEADLVLWTVGTKVQLAELDPGTEPYELPLNGRGQVETDETLRVRGHPRIFAVGDSSTLRDNHGKLLPATAQVAFQEADFAGWNIWAAINHRPLLPFRFQNLGEMMTLGRSDAALSPSFVEGLTLEGPIGHTARKIAYLIRLPTDEHRLKVGISWLVKSAVESIATVQSTVAKVLSGA